MPRIFALEDQGRFTTGYYHQKADKIVRKAAKEAAKKAAAEEAAEQAEQEKETA